MVIKIASTLLAAALFAAQGAPSFEVALIKANTSGTPRTFISGMQPGGRYTATNFTLKQLILQAYRIQDFQVAGGPPWLDTDRFDISAKADRAYTSSQLQPMMQTLLQQRFALAVHKEQRDRPLYTLVLDRRDRKFGPRLRQSPVDCAARLASGTPPAPPEDGKVPPCATEMRAGRHLIANGITMAQLSNLLSFQTHATVVDRTGLTGEYNVDLEWTPDQRVPGAEDTAPPVDAISIFTAVREQLGLKLEPHKGPVDMLVVDHAEHPTEN